MSRSAIFCLIGPAVLIRAIIRLAFILIFSLTHRSQPYQSDHRYFKTSISKPKKFLSYISISVAECCIYKVRWHKASTNRAPSMRRSFRISFKMNALAHLMLLYLTLILTSEFKLKHVTSNLFVGLDGDYPRWVTLQRSNTFEEKPSRVDGEKIITVKELKNKVWDIEGNRKYLIFYPEHGEVNQRFTIVKLARGNVRIKSANGQCIVYNEGEKKFERNDCADESVTQVFVLTDANGVAIGGAWGAGGEGGDQWGNEWGSGWGAGNGLFGEYKMDQKMALDELGRNARFLDSGIMSGGMYGNGKFGDKGMYGGGYSGSFMNQKLDGMFDTLPAMDKQRLLRMYYQNAGGGSQSGRYSMSSRTPSSYSFFRSF